MTAFTELLAAPAGPLAEGARNAMALVPAPINGFVFDSFLEYSLGDVPSATAALWPLRLRVLIRSEFWRLQRTFADFRCAL